MDQVMENTNDIVGEKKSVLGAHWKTRMFSFVALSALVSSCGYLSRETYYVVGDSFIAPGILSPENDLVLDAKVKLEQILLQKSIAEQALVEANSDLEAGEKAIVKLTDLKETVSKALTWSKQTTGAQVIMGNADMQTIATQKNELNEMITRQSLIVDDAKKNLDSGLIQRQDYDRELQMLDQIRVASFENDRTKFASELLLKTASMGQQALRAGNNGSAPMPDQVMAMNTLITVEVELLSTEAAMRAKLAEKEKDQEELSKINQLEKELRARPIFKAIDTNVDMAFASYQSLKGIAPGSRVMDCVWGVFACRNVGKVSEIIPAETIVPDVFGSGQVRGQFITLDLNKEDHDDSMHSKVLRVRSN